MKLNGIIKIERKPHIDYRGMYLETYNAKEYEHLGVNFVQDDISISSKGVLRGIHGDSKTYKLISCLYGKIYLVVLNCIEGDPQYGQWESFTLSTEDYFQILVPPGFGNGHLVLSDTALFNYKQSEYYDRDSQFSIKYDDPRFNIYWPIESPILSDRDMGGFHDRRFINKP